MRTEPKKPNKTVNAAEPGVPQDPTTNPAKIAHGKAPAKDAPSGESGTTKEKETEILNLLSRPHAGCEIPDRLRQTLLSMVTHGQVHGAGLLFRYDLAIFWR